MPRLPEATLRRLVDVDGRRHVAVVATVEGQCIGIGRYVALASEPGVAEVAVTVTDRYQGRGIGRLLVEALRPAAVRAGLTTLICLVDPTNRPALRLLQSLESACRGRHPRRARAVVVALGGAVRAGAGGGAAWCPRAGRAAQPAGTLRAGCWHGGFRHRGPLTAASLALRMRAAGRTEGPEGPSSWSATGRCWRAGAVDPSPGSCQDRQDGPFASDPLDHGQAG